MLYEQFYDEINAELQMLAAIEDEVKEKRVYIGSGEDTDYGRICEAATNKGVILYG